MNPDTLPTRLAYTHRLILPKWSIDATGIGAILSNSLR